jgi:hypothetical protein
MMSGVKSMRSFIALALALCVSARAAGEESNVALLGTASQSSTYPGGDAAKAIDGNTAGGWAGASVSHTGNGDLAPWWQVDLGQTYPIARIVIWNRTDACCRGRLSNFQASVLDAALTSVWSEQFFTDMSHPLTDSFEITLPEPTEGQVVRIDMLGPNLVPGNPNPYASFAEVQVFADASGAPLTITRQPAGVRTYFGRAVDLSVGLLDATGVTYQWKKDGDDVPGSTGPILRICQADVDDAGSYTVAVTRGAESITSDPAEVQVLVDDLALFGSASQSSTYPGGDAAKAIDGNADGNFANGSMSHTATGDLAPWWQVRLAAAATIDTIVLWNRTDGCCPERLSNFQVSILDESESPVYNEVFFDDLTYPDTTVMGFEIEVGGIEGRTVRIDILGENIAGTMYLSLAEVEVFGTSSKPLSDPNLAHWKSAAQSSTNAAYPARFGVDGNRSTFTHTLTDDFAASWEVDLCGTFDISTIVLWNRADCCKSRLRDITVEVLDGPGGAMVWASDLLNPENVEGGGLLDLGPERIVVDVPKQGAAFTKGGAVRVSRTPDEDLSGTGGLGNTDEPAVLSLAEVEVYGEIQCPAAGDTHCGGLIVDGPAEGGPGDYSFSADGTDDSGDDVLYTFTFDDGIHPARVVGPVKSAALSARLTWGTWTVTVSVDDSELCPDVAADASCSQQVVAVVDPDNVAPLGTAAQSTTMGSGAASNAIDGITNGAWDFGSVSHTGIGDPAPWWQVELDGNYEIDRLVFWNRTDPCCMLRLSNFRVRVLAGDGSDVYQEDFFTDLSYPDTTSEGFEISLGGIEGRTVRIEVLGNSSDGTMYLNLAEVQVLRSGGTVVPKFRRGDADGSGKLDLTDAISTLQYLYMGYEAPACKDAADTDDSGKLDLTDAISSLQYQFMGGTPPADPGPTNCGPDPTTGDEYTECTYTKC